MSTRDLLPHSIDFNDLSRYYGYAKIQSNLGAPYNGTNYFTISPSLYQGYDLNKAFLHVEGTFTKDNAANDPIPVTDLIGPQNMGILAGMVKSWFLQIGDTLVEQNGLCPMPFNIMSNVIRHSPEWSYVSSGGVTATVNTVNNLSNYGATSCWALDTNKSAKIDATDAAYNQGFASRQKYMQFTGNGNVSYDQMLNEYSGFCDQYQSPIIGRKITLKLDIGKGTLADATLVSNILKDSGVTYNGKFTISLLELVVPIVDSIPPEIQQIYANPSIPISTLIYQDLMYPIPNGTMITITDTELTGKPRWAIIGFQSNASVAQTYNYGTFEAIQIQQFQLKINNELYPKDPLRILYTSTVNAASGLYKNMQLMKEDLCTFDGTITTPEIRFPVDVLTNFFLIVVDLREVKNAETYRFSCSQTTSAAMSGLNLLVRFFNQVKINL